MMVQADQTEALSLRAAYRFAAEHGLEREAEEIRTTPIDWDLKIKSSVRRGYMCDLLEKHGLLNLFRDEHWSFGKTLGGEQKRKRYLSLKERYEDFLAGRGGDEAPEGDADSDAGEQQFAVEADLRDFLASHLPIIEPGLRLHQQPDRTGVEYPVDDGRIDILAVDKAGRFVVVELKVSRGRNRTIGQLLYYMGWVDAHLGNGPCRGMIVAREIANDLAVAAQRVPGVSLYRYRLSVSVEPVSTQTAKGGRSVASRCNGSAAWCALPARPTRLRPPAV